MINKIKSRLILTLFTVLLLYGCQVDANNQFIQGTWYNLDEHLQKVVGEMHLETVWTFSGNRYWMDACCFQEATEQGTYYILESSENLLVLELRASSGNVGGHVIKPNRVRELKIIIDFNEETLTFDRAVFTRFID